MSLLVASTKKKYYKSFAEWQAHYQQIWCQKYGLSGAQITCHTVECFLILQAGILNHYNINDQINFLHDIMPIVKYSEANNLVNEQSKYKHFVCAKDGNSMSCI